jgi:anti-sigma regulatory factor (Ser/Thr protein kinase)
MPERAAHPGFNQVPSAPGRLRLNVTSDPANLAAVRHACEAFCVQCGLDAAGAGDVGLCVNEAMANVIRHAYFGATDRPVDVNGWCDEAAVYVSVRDWGSGQVPKLRSKRDPLTPGGLGMVCLRELLDDVVYEPQPDGMLLTMTKRKA